MATLQKTFPAMGTVHSVLLYGEDLASLAERMKCEVLAMERAWSVFRADSTLSELNRRAGVAPLPVDDDTFTVLRESIALCTLTEGAFDITAGTLSALWRHTAKQNRLPPNR